MKRAPPIRLLLRLMLLGASAAVSACAFCRGLLIAISRRLRAKNTDGRITYRPVQESQTGSDLAEMLALLGLQPGRSTYEIDVRESSGVPPGSALTTRTRSVLGAMAYASQGIEVADYEVERGCVAPRAIPSPPYAPLLQVRSSETEPVDAFVAVPY